MSKLVTKGLVRWEKSADISHYEFLMSVTDELPGTGEYSGDPGVPALALNVGYYAESTHGHTIITRKGTALWLKES